MGAAGHHLKAVTVERWYRLQTMRLLLAKYALFCVALLAAIRGTNSSSGEDVLHSVEGRISLPSRGRPPPMKVTLNQGERWAMSKFDGTFEFRNVKPGIYVVNVISTIHHFGEIKIDVRPSGKVRALLFPYAGAKKVPTVYPLHFRVQGQHQYFVARPQLSILSIFRHPMILMMAPMMLMMFCLPKMMENVDPEELKQMQDKMKSSGEDPMDQLPAWLGGRAKDPEDSDED